MNLSNIYLSALRTLVVFDEEAVAIAIKLADNDVVETVEELVDFINFNIEDGKFPMISNPFEGNIIRKAVEKAQKEEHHLFFLKQEPTRSRYCNAFGYYDATNEKFVLKSGCILAFEIAEQYKDSTFANMREDFLSKHCEIKNEQYILREDTVMNSPTKAASYVTGRIVKTRTIWKDSEGHTLNDIYGKK